MPGRQFGQGENFPGVLVNGTTTVNGYSIPIDLNITGRATGDAAEYVASNSVEFGGEFESSVTDEFSAYIADGTYAGTGNQVTGGGAYGTAGRYRYGFNGKEIDNEVKGVGNAIDFGARIYDPRIGRWLSTDPLQAKYPSLTPYNFTGNNPTNYIDVDGKDTVSINKTITRYSLSTGRPVWGGGVTYSLKLAKGEDVFYYNGYLQTISATGVSVSPVKSTQFYPNSAGQVITGGSGLTESPSGILPFMSHGDDDYTSLAKLAPPGLMEDLAKRKPEKYGSLGLHRAGLNIGEAGKGVAGAMLLFEGGGILKKPDYTVEPNKFDYFFGRVNSSADNLRRSTQNLSDLTSLGIENNSDLIKVFDMAFKQGDVIKTTTTKFGTTIVKSAQVGENGAIHVGFFYEGGNMTATPRVASIIPKLTPKK